MGESGRDREQNGVEEETAIRRAFTASRKIFRTRIIREHFLRRSIDGVTCYFERCICIFRHVLERKLMRENVN